MEIAFDTEIDLNVSFYRNLNWKFLVTFLCFKKGCAAHQQIEILVQFRIGPHVVQFERVLGSIERTDAGGEPEDAEDAV